MNYHPHLLPQILAYLIDINRYARDYPPSAWLAFDGEFRFSVANIPQGPWNRLHGMAFHPHLRSRRLALLLPVRRSRARGWAYPAGPVSAPPGIPALGQGSPSRPLPRFQRPGVWPPLYPVRSPVRPVWVCSIRVGLPRFPLTRDLPPPTTTTSSSRGFPAAVAWRPLPR